MRLLWTCVAASVALGSGPTARFSIDGVVSTPSTTVATIQQRPGAPAYSWVRIYFYSSALAADDGAAAMKGRVGSIRQKWSAVLQLTVDKDSNLSQIDLSLPGHTCTIAESDRDAGTVLQAFRFDGRRLQLRGTGSHVCDMRSLGLPNQTFGWDVDLDIPVVEVARSSPG